MALVSISLANFLLCLFLDYDVKTYNEKIIDLHKWCSEYFFLGRWKYRYD